MERKTIMINEVIEGVSFINLPARIKDGKIGYPLQSWAVAEIMAKKVDDSLKPFVVIDFKAVDKTPFLLELNDGQTADPADDSEQKLIDYLLS